MWSVSIGHGSSSTAASSSSFSSSCCSFSFSSFSIFAFLFLSLKIHTIIMNIRTTFREIITLILVSTEAECSCSSFESIPRPRSTRCVSATYDGCACAVGTVLRTSVGTVVGTVVGVLVLGEFVVGESVVGELELVRWTWAGWSSIVPLSVFLFPLSLKKSIGQSSGSFFIPLQ